MMRFTALFVFMALVASSSHPAAAQQPKGKKGAQPEEPKVVDISDNVRQMIDAATGKYYKISGPYGRSYFVVGDDMRYLGATFTFEKAGKAMIKVMRIEIDVLEDERGIQMIGMVGAQIEQLKKDAKEPEVTIVTKGNETVEVKEKCKLTVVIGKPASPPQPKAAPKAPANK